MYTSSQLFKQDRSRLSQNCAVHPIQTARTYTKREKDAGSDCTAIVFQMRKGEKTSTFPTQAARGKRLTILKRHKKNMQPEKN